MAYFYMELRGPYDLRDPYRNLLKFTYNKLVIFLPYTKCLNIFQTIPNSI